MFGWSQPSRSRILHRWQKIVSNCRYNLLLHWWYEVLVLFRQNDLSAHPCLRLYRCGKCRPFCRHNSRLFRPFCRHNSRLFRPCLIRLFRRYHPCLRLYCSYHPFCRRNSRPFCRCNSRLFRLLRNNILLCGRSNRFLLLLFCLLSCRRSNRFLLLLFCLLSCRRSNRFLLFLLYRAQWVLSVEVVDISWESSSVPESVLV